MLRKLLIGIPILIAILIIFFPVLNPDLVPIQMERCGEYCENKDECQAMIDEDGLVQPPPVQPINTWTNIAFLISGFYVFRRRKSVTGVWYAVSCVVLGLGSGAFHSFLSKGGHFGDLLGMFLVFNFLAVYSMFATHKMKNYMAAVVLSAAASLVSVVFLAELTSTVIIAVSGLTLVVHLALAAYNQRVSWGSVGLALLPFGIAFIFRQMDVSGILCYPQSLYQGHGVWHVFAAIGIYSVFRLIQDLRFGFDAPGVSMLDRIGR